MKEQKRKERRAHINGNAIKYNEKTCKKEEVRDNTNRNLKNVGSKY